MNILYSFIFMSLGIMFGLLNLFFLKIWMLNVLILIGGWFWRLLSFEMFFCMVKSFIYNNRGISICIFFFMVKFMVMFFLGGEY